LRKDISPAVIKRLPRYYRYLGDLKEREIVRISSRELSERMHVTASQIRQDLNCFGGFGQQGYGYNVAMLYDEVGKILGLDKTYNLIVIGAGNLGRTIANYQGFEDKGFYVRALFDKDSKKIGKNVRGIDILSMDKLEDYIKKNKVDIAAITIPKESAKKVAMQLASSGIKAIWNFAHTDLRLPPDVHVQNVHLIEGLMNLSYQLTTDELEGNYSDEV
jgi:redox-sensing transcriptional repressor